MNIEKLIDDRKTKDYFGGGIYAIINKNNGKMYIGSSNDISARVKQHELSFGNMKCNGKIERDILAGDKFYSEILEKIELPCTLGYLLDKEMEYIKKNNAIKNGYNVRHAYAMYHRDKIIRNRAVQKYVKNNYDRVVLTLPKGKCDEIKRYAELDDKSMNAYIVQAIEEKISHDKER